MLLQRLSWWFVPLAALFALFIPWVTAQGLAGAYERVLFYYTYRMAVLSFGQDQNKILPNANCEGLSKHKSGGCNWMGFVNHVNHPGGRDALDATFFQDLDLDNPEPHEAARILDTRGEETRLFRVTRLLPGPNRIYDQVMPVIAKLVQECREKNSGLPKNLFDNVQTSMKEVIVLRQSDMFSNQVGNKGLIADIGTKYPGAVVRLNEDTYEHDDSRRIFSLDEAGTIADSPPRTFPSIIDLKNWASRYGKDTPPDSATADEKAANLHYKVIKELRLMKAKFSCK